MSECDEFLVRNQKQLDALIGRCMKAEAALLKCEQYNLERHRLQVEAERERDELVDLIEDIHWQLSAPVLSQGGAEAWLQDALKVLWRHGRLEAKDE